VIHIKKPGFFSTIQDAGRVGYQQFGVIVSGVMDEVAYRIGNALLHQENKAAIEMTLIGGTFEFTKSTTIALTGGYMEAKLNGRVVQMNKAIAIQAGDLLTCGAIRKGVRSYVCVRGGIDVPLVMGSRSTYLKARIGGHEGRALKAGDELPYMENEPTTKSWQVRTKSFYPEGPIRILKGTEWTRFSEEVQQAFLHNIFNISLEADRMGYRIVPKDPITIDPPFQLISEAVTFGTIQMPPNGEPIILMADRQTTGGYPKIGQVIAADLHRLAQLGPKQSIAFQVVSVSEAEFLYEQMVKELRLLELLLK
jgi:antagonist of KipI